MVLAVRTDCKLALAKRLLPTAIIHIFTMPTGVKLSKQVIESGNGEKFTYYAGNYVYEGSSLKFFNHAEGYVDAEGGYKYVYQYKDHLGNIRLSYQDVSETSTPSLQVLEENNYYPFGLRHKGYNNVVNGTHHPYTFNGKEEQEELGLNWHDFHARNYDASLGRWFVVDPLAEDPNQIDKSPYNYAVNNPILYNDPDGKCPPWICGALAGGLVEAGSQYIANLAKGDSWTDAALNIDGADVLAATIEGGITGGGSVARRLLVKGGAMVVSEVVQATVDAEVGNFFNEGLDGVEIETDASEIATGAAIGIGANLLGEGVEGTMKAVVNSKHTKELTQVNKELKKSMKGSNGEAVRTTKQAELQSMIKGNKAVSETTGTVTTEVVDEKLNGNR